MNIARRIRRSLETMIKRDLVIAVAGAAFGVIATLTAQGNAAQEVLKVENAAQDAARKQDIAAWERTVTDDAMIVLPDGKVQTRAERAADIKNGVNAGPASGGTPTGQQKNYKARVYGDTVITTWDGGPQPNTPKGVRRMRVWVKRNGSWQMAHSQLTAIQ